MSKIEFCNLLFEYISDSFTIVDIETEKDTHTFNFETDTLFLADDYFELPSDGMFNMRIYYKDVKSVSC